MHPYIASLEMEWLDFTSRVVGFRSLPGEEGPIADFFLAAFAAMGVEAFSDEAGNVIAILRGEGRGPNIMLNGHLDVVTEGSLENWLPYQPFEATLAGRNLVGRGLADLKAGLTAQFFAFRMVKQAVDRGMKLPGDLLFTLVVQEEPAESMGMLVLMDETLPSRGLTADLVYLCEPSSGDLALGHRGKVELVVTVRGRTAHSSQPKQGVNALEKALPILQAVFSAFGEPAIVHPILGESSMTVVGCRVEPSGLSIVPDFCEIAIDRRYVPPETTADTIAQVQHLLDDLAAHDPDFAATVAPRTTFRRCYTGYEAVMAKEHPGWHTDPSHPFVRASFEALRAIGQAPAEKIWKFGTDGSVTAGKHGIPTIGYSFAEEKWAHQPKEQVSIDAMLATIEGYAAMLARLYGLALEDLIPSA